MEPNLKVNLNRDETCDFFSFHGNIDAQAETSLKEIPGQVRTSTVKFDFSKTGRINSMGIAFLLRCLKSIRDEKKAEVYLSGLSPMNTMLFKMTGIFLLASPSK